MSSSRGLVLLTGGVGFIGRAVADVLTADGADVRALDVLNEQVHLDPERAVAGFPGEVVVGDVRETAEVSRAMAGCDAVVHLAAETGVGQSMYQPQRYRSVNVTGTETVLHHAARQGLPVVVFSSRAVYGQGASECPEHGRRIGRHCCAQAVASASREDDPPAPTSVYGQTKVDAEQAAQRAAAAGVPVVCLRPQNVIGAGQAVHNPYTGVLAAFASRLSRGLAPQVYGTGEQTRDFLDVVDVARTVAHLLDHVELWPAAPTVNVGSGVRTTLVELADTACRAAGLDLAPEHVAVSRPGDIDHACADLTLARRVGVPAVQRPLLDSVGAFLAYAATQGDVDPGRWDDALAELAAVRDVTT